MRKALLACIAALGAASGTAHAQDVTCADGTTSAAGRGACSHHGGIAKTRASHTTRDRERTRDRDRVSVDAKVEGVRCYDGSWSTTTGRGACSHHGGIAPPYSHAGDDRVHARRSETDTRTHAPTPVPDVDKHARVPAPELVVKCADGSVALRARDACAHNGGVASEIRRDHPWWGDEHRDDEPTAVCKDGAISYAAHHRGACSGHGGVRDWLDD
jgi:hypothetical protein